MYSLLCIPDSGFTPPARGAGDFSTGIMGIIAPALTGKQFRDDEHHRC
jgi:hypothetical protein